jgi:hypothetical protein
LQPRSTDPSGTHSRIRRGSSRHASPRLAPPLAGRQATVAAARCATVGHHRSSLRPVRARESSLGDPHSVPRPRPAGPGRRFTGILPECRRPVPKGPIARGDFFLRANPQTRGIFVRSQIFPGTLLQVEYSIVFDDLLILRKSLENRRSIGKMQTQFCWIPGKIHYNFCKACPCFY